MVTPPNYVDLNRRFAPIRPEAEGEASALRSYVAEADWFLPAHELSWADILKHRLVVILGEPGSGKTYEMQYQAARESSECLRFYLRLDELAVTGDKIRLSDDDVRRFEKWKSSDNRAVFFLDSVDEAKIHQISDFYRALDRFIDLVSHRTMTRATIVISSRITEWLPTADGHELRVRFPQVKEPSEDQQSSEPYPFVVQILPLDRDAVTIYVKERGVPDVDRFLEGLDKAHGWELARRPADVNDLLSFWRESGSLGTLSQILDHVCNSQLRKTSDRERSEILSLKRARRGAECLAAATVLCRRFAFQIPGEINASEKAIDALTCLPPDWRSEEARSLLNHALFDGASYGHIRFHHRRLSEFLAAQWFNGLMSRGCPGAELEELLFESRGSAKILRPSLAPLAAWLSGGAERWNTTVFRRVIDVAPEVLLRYGDPAQLATTDRRALLRALLKKADGRQHLWWENDHATLSRLATPALAPEINELLTTPSSGRSLRELGLEIISAGVLSECAPTVLSVAISDLKQGRIFPAAARALKIVASDSHLRELAKAAEDTGQLPERVYMGLCELLFPQVWTVSELFKGLGRMTPAKPRAIGWDYSLSKHLTSVIDENNSLSILRGLLGHPIEDEDEEDLWEPPWSVRISIDASKVILARSTISDEEASAIAEVLVRTGNRRYRYHSGKEDSLPELTTRHPLVRERYFQLAAKRLAAEHSERDISITDVAIFYDWLKPCSVDLLWILDWLNCATTEIEREHALRWALDLWWQTGRARADLVLIKRQARAFRDTRKQLRKHLHPGISARVKAFWNRNIRYRFRRYRWQMFWSKTKAPFIKLKSTWNLWRHRNKIRSGQFAGWLVRLVSEACGESRNQWTPTDWKILETKRGKRCAAAVKEGCKRLWETYSPPLPHEKKPDEGTTNGTIAGLAGIMAGWLDGKLRFEDLSCDDARRATRYALNELNGFAPWFDDLAKTQKKAVTSVLAECISGEWDWPADSKTYHLVLHDLAWSESSAADMIKPLLMEKLSEREPKNPDVLHNALRILLLPQSAPQTELATLATRRLIAIPSSSPTFAPWMAMWLQTDAIPAITALETRLKNVAESAQVMTRVCAEIGSRLGEKLPSLSNPSWMTPAAMRRLIPLIYRYIRREEDIERHSGASYSPTARDDAQDFRNGMLERLAAMEHPEVGEVLQELLTEPLLSTSQDYMRHLLEKHCEKLADGRPWRTGDVRVFAAEYERDPQTDADLFRIGVRRLLELKQWVEDGEDSPREEVNSDNNESGFRRWLQRRLNEQSRGRFVVPQEWEIDGGSRPDLRLVIPNAAPVSLELKIADNWTLQELLDGLENQLVETYLRDHRARYGIYILALFRRNRKWDSLDDGPRIDSQQLVAILRSKADEILQGQSDLAGLEIVLFHFSST